MAGTHPLSTAFPDANYSASNKPSVVTLQNDIATTESVYNAHDNDTAIHVEDSSALVTKTGLETLTNKTLSTGTKVDANADSNITQYGMSRQAIMNGNFDVWQRGTSVALADVTNTFLADRWREYVSKDSGTLPTLTRSRQLLTSGDIPNAFYFTRLATNGAGSSFGNGAYHLLEQKIENGVRNLCGLNKKVTVSFWARSSIANKKLGIGCIQNYGTGGSPTAQEFLNGEAITLTSTWTKYTKTFTTNTLVGKTFGTAADDVLRLGFYHMWGSTEGTNHGFGAAETFVGSGNIDIAQVQFCAGDVALPFQPKSFEEELRACQRYFQIISSGSSGAVQTGTTTQSQIGVPLRATMRESNPSISLLSGASFTNSLIIQGVTNLSPTAVSLSINGFNGVSVVFTGHASATANSVVFVAKEIIGLDAEL